MIHPHTELRFISSEIGYGVVATQFIPKGTICWAFDAFDQVFSPAQVGALDQLHKDILNKYSYRDAAGNLVLCWDNARFVNHSFNSSLVSTAYNFELAVRDIQPGEELTDDYGYLNVWEPFDALTEPGSPRTRVLPNDLLHFHAAWDAQLIEAFRHFHHVAQPLVGLIEPAYAAKVQAVAAGQAPMDSIVNCYYHGQDVPALR
ncbi:SET domain-containing protein [Hymenobacter busanensis]|uniref:SET domain-containing protein n=1 Tax=Hymenobacter busanensis TaxID=2607656 RepID=A0A7L4ZUE7_9BACT|nr:SET domain-containing protein [Hymenobacter busanensis]KAA9339702.1 SET domain-containing protein [Hymenobacter busanensis]QHJ06543.1 SET domain-containing protein-lysine N-methyltransferase [Hymenobacter busanensis]